VTILRRRVMGETEILADYALSAKYEDLPEAVIEKPKQLILNHIGCAFGGSRMESGQATLRLIRDMGGKPESTIIADGTKVPCLLAGYLNSILLGQLDYDATLASVGHPSISIIPAGLAVGERVKASGKEWIIATVVGFDVCIRVIEAIRASFDVFWKGFARGSGEIFGPTAAAGRMLGLSTKEMTHAFGFAGGGATPLRGTGGLQRGLPGLPFKGSRGVPTATGIWAAFLAKEGFASNSTILEGERGYWAMVGSDQCDYDRMTADLGKKYEIMRIAFKNYPCCQWIQSTATATDAIVQAHHPNPEDIEQIIVTAQPEMAEYMKYEWKSMMDTEFCIPYDVAMVILGVKPGVEWHTGEHYDDPKVHEIANKVKHNPDPELAKDYYYDRKYVSTVEILMKDGRRLLQRMDYGKGEPENPFTREDLINKVTNLALPKIKQDQLDEIITMTERLEEVDNLSELTWLLAVV